MNYIVSVFALVAVIATNPVWAEEHETKKVCVDVMKDGKPVKDAKGVTKQNCKTVREHKKLEVTK
jgi:uncharacterized protein (DUF1697 family)